MSDSVVARNDEFDRRVAEDPLIRALQRTSRQHKRMIRWLGGSLAFDIVLSIVLSVVAVSAHDTASKASHASNQALVNCLAGNQARAATRQLWTFVLSFPPPPNETPSARKTREEQVAMFRRFIDKTFAQQDCAHPQVQPSSGPLPASPVSGENGRHTVSSGPASAATPSRGSPRSSVPSSPRPSKSLSPVPAPSRPTPTPTPTRSRTPTPHPVRSCVQNLPKCVLPGGVASLLPPSPGLPSPEADI